MTEAYDQLIASIENDRPLDPQHAKELLDKYPFFTLPASRALASGELTEADRRHFLSSVALNAPDAATLITLIDPDGARFANFYPTERGNATPSTDSAIDTFLDTYGRGIDPHEQALLERLIFNPAPDYSEVLVREAAEAPAADTRAEELSEQDMMLEAFLSSQASGAHPDVAERPEADKAEEEEREAIGHRPEHHPKPDPEAPLSESLAKIFIKRGRYDKAYEIIKQLSLNFPEKSVYFADQLRFLRKLMVNESYGKGKKQEKQ